MWLTEGERKFCCSPSGAPACEAVRTAASASGAQESALKAIVRAGALRESSLTQNKAEV